MLDSLNGTLIEFQEDYAIIDVNGLRFRTEIPASTASQLPAAGTVVTIRTRLSFNANDGQFNLFGFATETERDCYDILTSMSGIGPKKALAILSQIEIAAFATAIVNKDVRYVSQIKGVGPKTAERLIVELREKMVPYIGAAPAAAPSLPRAHNIQDAIAALMALGCKPAVAEKAVRIAVDVLGEAASVESLVKEGLKHR